MRIYYITRTYNVSQESADAGNIRNTYVRLLRKKYEVTVVTPGTDSQIADEEDVILVPYRSDRLQFDLLCERSGIKEDYLDDWVDTAFKALRNIVKEEDIVFATTGGELGCIKLAVRLKVEVACKVIINFHDPINYTTVNGRLTGGKVRIHVSRDKLLDNYIRFADLVITSSKSYREILCKRYPNLKARICNSYFGYSKRIQTTESKPRHPVRAVYAGIFGNAQKPERFINAIQSMRDVKLEYVAYVPRSFIISTKRYDNVIISTPKPYTEYLNYMNLHADIGLVSLYGCEWGACVPSKIFELINLEIPIFAILPHGDARDIIDNKYGVVASSDSDAIQSRWQELLKEYDNYRLNMRRDKEQWYAENLIKEVYIWIEELYRQGHINETKPL